MSKKVSAAIYCRISRDRDGHQLGVKRQERLCKTLADDKGWEVVEVYVDDDESAFSGRGRPQYRRMLGDIKSGRVTAVVVWHTDRLYRRLRDLEDFIDLVNDTRCRIGVVQSGDLDLTTRDGRMLARMVATFSSGESEAKSERLRAKHDELAQNGLWKGGPRPYGYTPDGRGGLTIVREEASVIREAARRVLAGETVYAVCRDFNERKVPTAKGAPWRTPTLRRVLTSFTVAGRREHHGVDVRAASVAWKPILDDLTWSKLRSMLLDPSRSRARPARCYLLTGGLARCGVCGSPLHAQRRTSGKRAYACTVGPDKLGCGKIYCHADPLEASITEAVLQAVDSPALASALRPDADDEGAMQELQAIDARMIDLAEVWASGQLSRLEWLAAREALDRQQSAARRRLIDTSRATALDSFVEKPGALRASWPSMTLDQRRAVVAAAIAAVVIQPASRRGPVFDPDRIAIAWRHQEAPVEAATSGG
jgi:DNA invertase Pin-like site-specific DNA recombinase